MSDSNKQSFLTGSGKVIFQSALSAIVFSSIFIVVLFATKTVEPSTDTYIGLIAGFIAISVAIVIGYQIYNTIDMKSKIADFESQFNEHKSLISGLERRTERAYIVQLELLANSFCEEGDNQKNIGYKLLYYIKSLNYLCEKLKREKNHELLGINFEQNIISCIIKCVEVLLIEEKMNHDAIIEFGKAYNTYDDGYIKSHRFKDDLDIMIDILLKRDEDKIQVIHDIRQKYEDEKQ